MIKDDLDLLKSLKLLKYKYAVDRDYIYESALILTVYEMQEQLFELIETLEGRNREG